MKALVKQQREPGIWMRGHPGARRSAPTTCSSRSPRPRSAAPTCTSTTGTRGRRRPSRCRWPSATSTAARSSRWAARCAASAPAIASRAKATSPAATAATAAPAAATCAATPSGVGVNRPGAFAEYLAIPAVNAFKLPDAIHDDIASILDPFGNATHTALAFNMVGEDVLITGAGPDRHHGGRDRALRRRAPRRDHRRQRLPPGSGAQDGRHARDQRRARIARSTP